MSGEQLNKDDLFLMLKSYENQVEFTTRLYDRQNLLIKEQEKIVASLTNVVEKQTEIQRDIEKLFRSIIEHNAINVGSLLDTKTAVVSNGDKISGVAGQLVDLKIIDIKYQSDVKVWLIAISVAISSVILSLGGALWKIWEKSDIIDAVAKFIGVQQ